MDIILLVRDKIRQFTSPAYATRELKKVFDKFDPDDSGHGISSTFTVTRNT